MADLASNVYAVGAIDWDRGLFDELIPLPDGTSYNSFLIKGSEKTALIDTVDPSKTKVLIDKLVKHGVSTIDYVIANHAEQDHSGSIPDILTLYPSAKIVTNAKCKAMLIDLLDVEDEDFIIVEDGQEMSLGDKTLQFVLTSWVHWPETMSTYLKEDKILFSCDFFGSHYATSSLFIEQEIKVKIYDAAKRYYAEIMMPFRRQISSNLSKLDSLEIDVISPSHGPSYDDPAFIMDAYKDWVSDDVKNEVMLSYVSMHGSTKTIVEYLSEALIERGIAVKEFNLITTDLGKLAMSLVDAATVVIGSPTVLAGLHPAAANAAVLINALRPKTKFVSIVGSYGWGGRTVEQLSTLLSSMKAEMLDPVMVKGYPREGDLIALDRLAEEIFVKHKELGIID